MDSVIVSKSPSPSPTPSERSYSSYATDSDEAMSSCGRFSDESSSESSSDEEEEAVAEKTGEDVEVLECVTGKCRGDESVWGGGVETVSAQGEVQRRKESNPANSGEDCVIVKEVFTRSVVPRRDQRYLSNFSMLLYNLLFSGVVMPH